MPLPTDAEILAARTKAADTHLAASEAESVARKLRKIANDAQTRYDNLLRERDYMTIDDYQEA